MPKGHYDRTVKREGFGHRVEVSAELSPPVTQAPIRLTAPFGFVTEIDAVYFKPAGSVITNPLEIAALRERMAPIEDV